MKVFVAVFSALMAYAHGAVIGAPTQFMRTPQFDSAVIQSERLGGNFAYSSMEAHAYAAMSPIIQNVQMPVGVSYQEKPIIGQVTYHEPAQAAIIAAPAPVYAPAPVPVYAPAPVPVYAPAPAPAPIYAPAPAPAPIYAPAPAPAAPVAPAAPALSDSASYPGAPAPAYPGAPAPAFPGASAPAYPGAPAPSYPGSASPIAPAQDSPAQMSPAEQSPMAPAPSSDSTDDTVAIESA